MTEIQILRDNGIAIIDTDQDTWTLEHHGIPEHGFPGGFGDNPNTPTVQNYSFPIPKVASIQDTKGCVRLGAIGMSISGVPFFNPYTGRGKNAVEGDCQETFDDCSGHPDRSGIYHYHKLPACIYNHTPNQFLGVAFDGFPIYGPMDESGKNIISADLDDCHGHWHNGRYKYRITRDFPYILGCYSGSAPEMVRDGPPGMLGGGNRPGMRMKREYSGDTINENDRRVKRQTYGNCMSEEYPEWRTATCYAFCENPSDRSYDECTPSSAGDTTPSSTGSLNGTTFRNDLTTINASNGLQFSVSVITMLPLLYALNLLF